MEEGLEGAVCDVEDCGDEGGGRGVAEGAKEPAGFEKENKFFEVWDGEVGGVWGVYRWPCGERLLNSRAKSLMFETRNVFCNSGLMLVKGAKAAGYGSAGCLVYS